MSNNPAVSIIVPAYNVAEYIEETLESLFAQSYRDFEAIVVNDGSTDNTDAAIAPFFDRIVYIKKRNGGVMTARNAGLNAARGRYIALLDGDDLWHPNFLEVLVGMLEADPSITVAYPNAYFFGSPQFSGKLHQDVFPVAEPVTFDRVLRRECYIFGSLVFRRAALDQTGPFDESLRGQGAEDLELWLRLLLAGHLFKFTSEPLVKYRWRHNSLSNTGVGLLSCVISVYEKFKVDDRLTAEQRDWIDSQLPDWRAQLNLARFKERMKERNYKDAAPLLAQANEHYRSAKLKLMQAALRVSPQIVRLWANR